MLGKRKERGRMRRGEGKGKWERGEVVNDHPASGALPSSSFNMDPHQNHGSLTVISSMH